MMHKTPLLTPKRCAIYTRKSSEEGLEQSFNSLDAQREACEAYILSQQQEGWTLDPTHYDDGGFSGGTIERPALKVLLHDVCQNQIDIIIVHKIDRLSRSLADFVRLVEVFEKHETSFVSVTQQFNTSTSMGRLTLNVLLSFAQFEREVTGERIRDKIAASKQKGLWMGGICPVGYDVRDKQLIINEPEAETVRHIYNRYLSLGNVRDLKAELDKNGFVSKLRQSGKRTTGGNHFSRGALYTILRNPLYNGEVSHHGKRYPGKHQSVIDKDTWKRVQQRLANNQIKQRRQTKAKEPSPLAGLLFDDKGNAMSPTHATKRNRRYRYYISQAVLQYREQEAGSVLRVSAPEIENRLRDRLQQLLTDNHELLDAFAPCSFKAEQIESLLIQAKEVASTLAAESDAGSREIIRKLINKAVISKDRLVIQVSISGLVSQLNLDKTTDGLQEDYGTGGYTITVPATIKRTGIEKRLVIGGADSGDAPDTSIKAIQKALAKALQWNQELLEGRVTTMTALAKQNNVTQQYISHILKLSYLAPDVIRAIHKGNIPSRVTLGTLKKGIPLPWSEQRNLFQLN